LLILLKIKTFGREEQAGKLFFLSNGQTNSQPHLTARTTHFCAENSVQPLAKRLQNHFGIV
jgi:hypothetical protein